jgi:tetratricopeptide (TPR) repeat protein
MKTGKLMMLSKLVIIIFFSGMIHFIGICAETENVDWWQAQSSINKEVMEKGTSIASLAKNAVKSSPTSNQEAMYKLCVLTRAGMNKEAIQSLQELKKQCSKLDNYQISSIYYDACDNLQNWDMAKAVVEMFADNVSEIALDNRLLKHLADSGWTTEKIDEWLAGMPKGVNQFWVKERLRFNMANGSGETLLKELMNVARSNPDDIDGAIAFFDAYIYARHGERDKKELAWMGQAFKPKLATQACDFASRFENLNDWETASAFYRQAIEIPLTDDEVKRLAMNRQAIMPGSTLKAAFDVQIREGLAKCLLELSKKDEAQKWMVEAADIREKNKLGRNAVLAGLIQGESGQRTIEGRIKAEEKKSENDPAYWRERADYYRGRKENSKEEDALKKGLALTTPQESPERASKGQMDWRSWMLSDYARFLSRDNRIAEAIALLRKEIEESPATSESSKKAANLLAFDFEKQIIADDEVLWKWLSGRQKWEYTEERLLWRMLENAKKDDLDKHFSHAEEIVKDKDPSRASTLGWIMNRMNSAKRSIPLLKSAIENSQDKELVEKTTFTLLESYLDTGDWKNAEKIFPVASKRLTSGELPQWYSKIAVSAAKAGAKEDAMRIWACIANINPSSTAGLDSLAKTGLKNELIEFYRKMKEEMPSSEIPDKVIKELENY